MQDTLLSSAASLRWFTEDKKATSTNPFYWYKSTSRRHLPWRWNTKPESYSFRVFDVAWSRTDPGSTAPEADTLPFDRHQHKQQIMKNVLWLPWFWMTVELSLQWHLLNVDELPPVHTSLQMASAWCLHLISGQIFLQTKPTQTQLKYWKKGTSMTQKTPHFS